MRRRARLQIHPTWSTIVPPIVRQLVKNQQAATLIEYSLIVALVATAAVSAMGTVGASVLNILTAAAVAMN